MNGVLTEQEMWRGVTMLVEVYGWPPDALPKDAAHLATLITLFTRPPSSAPRKAA